MHQKRILLLVRSFHTTLLKLTLYFSGQNYCTGQASSQRFSKRLGHVLQHAAERTSEDEALHVLPLRADHDLQRDGREENAIHQSRIRVQGTFLGKAILDVTMGVRRLWSKVGKIYLWL